MFASIRDACCFAMQLQVIDGMGGRIQHDLLLIHITISTTIQQTISVESMNPAPLNASAPNLVAVEHDKFGVPHFNHAFNTQASFDKKI
jgi:hypothetical protein